MEVNSICGNMYHCKPLLIGELVIYAFGSVIQIVSNVTGELIGSFKQHTKIVTSITNANDGNKIISSSIDGLIIIWDRDSFSENSRHEVSSPVYNIIVPSLSKNRTYEEELYLVVGINHNNDNKNNNKSDIIKQNKKNELDNFKLIAYDLKAKKIRRKVSHVRDTVQNISLITYHEEEFIIVSSNHKIFLWSIEEKKHIGSNVCSTVGAITSITVSNSKNVVITGHENGEITIWHNLISCLLSNNPQNNPIDPTNTIMHWHAHPVVALSTSIDGEYIYSGGEEGVLVVWQLSTGIKSFIPRLGEAITYLTSSKSEAKVIVTSKDNSIRIINLTTMKEDWLLRSVSIRPNKVSKSKVNNNNNNNSENDSFNLQFPSSSSIYQADPTYKCKIAIENRTGYIVCNGYPGELQSLDMNTKSYRSSHEIVNYTRISKKDSISRMFVPSTTYFDFIHTIYGDFLITIDVQRGEDTDSESSLKFWEWSNDCNKYILNAQVDHPHNAYRVTSASFSPFNLLSKDKNHMNYITCTTCGIDGTVKVWRGILPSSTLSSSNIGKSKIQWSCSYAFKHRDSPVQNISFSIDGSLLAVAQENTVTLWNPSNVELKASIVGPITNNIIFTAFIEPKASIFQGG
jgi:NET1-associated nuclear protein 1 (U3 small nucleolar RNA-associated protein 17)